MSLDQVVQDAMHTTYRPVYFVGRTTLTSAPASNNKVTKHERS